MIQKPEILNDEEVNKAWDGAFDKPINFDHKPTAEEMFTIRLKAVAQVQRDKDSEYYETIIKENKKEMLEQFKIIWKEIDKHSLCETVGLFARPVPIEDCGWYQSLQSQLEEARGK